jgi:hypothetical protein
MYFSASTNSSTPMKLDAGISPCARGEQIGEEIVPQPASGSGKTRPSVMYCWSEVADEFQGSMRSLWYTLVRVRHQVGGR